MTIDSQPSASAITDSLKMMNTTRLLSLFIVAIASLAGCATSPPLQPTDPLMEMREVSLKLSSLRKASDQSYQTIDFLEPEVAQHYRRQLSESHDVISRESERLNDLADVIREEFQRPTHGLDRVNTIELRIVNSRESFKHANPVDVELTTGDGTADIIKLRGAGSDDVCLDYPVLDGFKALIQIRLPVQKKGGMSRTEFGIRDEFGNRISQFNFGLSRGTYDVHEIRVSRNGDRIGAHYKDQVYVGYLNRLSEKPYLYFSINAETRLVIEELRTNAEHE